MRPSAGIVPDGAEACFVQLVDGVRNAADAREFLTEDPSDDLSGYCADQGWNLEFLIRQADGVVFPSGTSARAECQLSTSKVIDCPQLP